jgi:hypothetical protein
MNNFQKGGDKLSNIGVGKIQMIKQWLNDNQLEGFYHINDDLTIDIEKDVNFRLKKMGDFPSYIQFGKINGGFDCSRCNMTTLRGCPTYVKKFFFCEKNKLTNLKFMPKYIGATFSACDNNITDLSDLNSTIMGDTWLSRNLLSEKEIFKFENRLYKNNTNHGIHTNDQRNKSDNLNLDEAFIKGSDKLSNLGVGKEELIKRWLEDYKVKNYRINSNYDIDVMSTVDDKDGSVRLSHENLTEFPSYIQFNNIEHSFVISHNYFKTLRGGPRFVGGIYNACWNELESLEFAPKAVGSDTWFNNNNLSDKEIKNYMDSRDKNVYHGSKSVYTHNQRHIDEAFTKGGDKLVDLGVGKIAKIKEWLEKNNIKNYRILDTYEIDVLRTYPIENIYVDLKYKNMEELPHYIQFRNIQGSFSIGHNNLKTLRGGPKSVEGIYDGGYNDLTSLEFAPEVVKIDTWFNNNKLLDTEIEKYMELRGKSYMGNKNIYFYNQFK